MSKVTYSYDHRTAWRYAYNVYRDGRLLGLVYKGSDERWHAITPNGNRELGWPRRSDAGYYLAQPGITA